MTTQQGRHVDTGSYYESLGEFALKPLWRHPDLLPDEPRSRAVPYVWRYAELRELLMDAGELISAEQAERRVLMLMNPGLDGRAAATTNLYAGLQLVLPGEIAPAHRHTSSALRFIVEGVGGHTVVDNERIDMNPGDLVLTPNWTWHDHRNFSAEPIVWLDGLDLPIVNALEANFFERSSAKVQPLDKPDDASHRMYAAGRLNPAWESWGSAYSPVFKYPWTESERGLRDLSSSVDGSRTDGIILEYTNPRTGGPVLPTLACYLQALAPGQHTEAHRHTSSAIYHVVDGHGSSIVDGQELAWEARDTFALPGWAVHEHVNGSSDSLAILFSFTDEPAFRALGCYRERACERQG